MTELTRRDFLIAGGALAVWATGCTPRRAPSPPAAVREPVANDLVVNDVHAQLNATTVDRIVRPDSLAGLQAVVQAARAEGKAISIAGSRHAMGGQQFGRGTILVDMRAMSRVLGFDAERGTIDVEAGIEWPEMIQYLLASENGAPRWGIIQKQAGADRLTIGGALAANVHGRGLRMKPIIADVESFVLVDADGTARTCSRTENTELFRLAIGGYGLFGPIASVRLRLAPRQKLERIVKVMDVDGLMPAFEKRIAEGCLFGDFQYATDYTSRDFLRKGLFSCYRPVEDARAVPDVKPDLTAEDWRRFLFLSHVDKTAAFEAYARHHLATSGQLYWSDTHQQCTYIDDYHAWLDERLGMLVRATEMITEIYVPRAALTRFLDDVRRSARADAIDIVYGTIRLIERDDESFLASARQPWACVTFSLHVMHVEPGFEGAARACRRLIDIAIAHRGSYDLTYHRWATRQQVETCHPRFVEFLRRKRAHDPEGRFQSEWYRHYVAMFADAIDNPAASG